jgi:hypothetical protein
MAKIEFLPVGNGDMTLITLDNKKQILIDCNIRAVKEGVPDANEILREKLTRTNDSNKQLYVDAFLWTHPDQDHCRGIREYFHLGKPGDWKKEDDKIFIREIWSSPIVFKRADSNHTLSDDAKALNREAKRRVNEYKASKKLNSSFQMVDGNKVTIICHDDDKKKTDDISEIVQGLDTSFTKFGSQIDIRVLGPAATSDLKEQEDKLGKNHSSVIVNMTIKNSSGSTLGQFLNGGDAEVVCWDNLWSRLKEKNHTSWLEYDVMQAPHHCSWRSLSHESWSDTKGKAKASDDAYSALSQGRDGAYIVTSSKKVVDDYIDPPCIGAKRQYLEMLNANDKSGTFKCVADVKQKGENISFELDLTSVGIVDVTPKAKLSETADIKKAEDKQGTVYA